jgi:carboxylate-amine ligase
MEEELFLVEPASLALSHCASSLLPRVRAREGTVMFDTYEAMVETASPVVANAVEGALVLDGCREDLRAAGASLVGSGLHPDAAFGDVVHVDQDRYRAVAEYARGLLERTPTAAIHVHVGMPDPETAIAACNRVRAHLPVLQGLAAHSPFWHGRDARFATARAQAWRAYPPAVIPREFAGWEDYVQLVGAVVEAGELPDYTYLWWDVRPHPNLGTLEVRAMDAQARIGSVMGLAALTHALVVRAAHEDDGPVAPVEVLTQSSYRAGRDGLRSSIWFDGAVRPFADVARATLELARPYARDAGGEDALEEVERILVDGNGADRMRAAHARGGMEAVLRALAEETATPLGRAAGAAG